MSLNKQLPLEEALKKAFEEESTEVPDMLWVKIEDKLFEKPKRKLPFWILGVLLLTGISMLLGKKYYFNNNQTSKAKANTKEIEQTVKPNLAQKSEQESIIINGNHVTKRANNDGSMPEIISPKSTSKHPIGNSELQLVERKSTKTNFKSFSTKTNSEITNSSINKTFTKSQAANNPTQNPVGKNNEHLSKQNKNNMYMPFQGAESIVYVPLKVNNNNRLFLTIGQTKKLMNYGMALPSKLYGSPIKPGVIFSKDKKYSYSLFYGPSLFDLSHYQNFLRSGVLSNVVSNSKGFSTGLGVSKKFRRQLSFQVGLSYDVKNISIKSDIHLNAEQFIRYNQTNGKIDLNAFSQVDCDQYFTVANALLDYQLKSVWVNAQSSKVLITHNKLSASGSAGFSTNLLSTNKMHEQSDFSSQPNKLNNKILVNGFIGVELDYNLSENITIGFAPYLQKQLVSWSNDKYKLNKEIVLPVKLIYRQ